MLVAFSRTPATTSSVRHLTAPRRSAAAKELRPAIVLLDIQLPDVDGFEVALRLTRDLEPPAVVLTSSHDASDFGGMITPCGARGFLAKAELSGFALAALLK